MLKPSDCKRLPGNYLHLHAEYVFIRYNLGIMKGGDELESVVKINYTIEVPLNDAFREEFTKFLVHREKAEEGLKNYLIDNFLLEYFTPVISRVKEEYEDFGGKFSMEIRHEVLKGVFQGKGLVRASLDESLRQDFTDRFRELLKTDAFRVDINLGCMI